MPRVQLLVLPLFVWIIACGGGNAASSRATPPAMPLQAGQTKCSVLASQNKPLIVEWTSDERADLEALVRQNKVVPVRYVGCEMEVLEQCVAPGRYDYVPFTAKHERVTMLDEDDLYANMPIGAAKLTAKLAQSKQITVDMTLVGKFAANRPAIWQDELHGACDGATHVVVGLMAGAFELTAGGDATMGGSVGIAGVGAGGSSHASRELLRSDGADSACTAASFDDKSPPSGCGALLKIELVKLGVARASAAECPASTTWDGKTCLDTAPPAAPSASTAPPVGPAIKCIAGQWDAARGCVATSPLVVYTPMRQWATRDLEQRYLANKGAGDSSSLKEVVEIAVALARQKPQERSQWYARALEHWRVLARDPANEAQKGASVSYAAESDYSLVAAEADQRMKLTGCPASTPGGLFGQFEGNALVSTGRWQQLAQDAELLDDKLDRVARTYPAALWIGVATARRGLLYDALRSAILACERGKGMDLFAPKQRALLDKLRAAGMTDKADEIENAVAAAWAKKRATEADATATVAVRELATSIVLATAYGLSHDVLTTATARFAALHKDLGDAAIRTMLAGRVDPTDPDRRRTLDAQLSALP